METPKILPKHLDGRQTTIEEWNTYQLDLKNHKAWCDNRLEFAKKIIQLCIIHGPEITMNGIEREISQKRSMDAPNPPGYYIANND